MVGFPAPGSWAERIAVPARAAIPVPPEIGDEVAAQLLINYVTARMILRALRKSVTDEALRDGAVLITGAGTVVARLLLHFLAEEGFAPIGLARSAASAGRIATALPGVRVSATQDADWPAQVAYVHRTQRQIIAGTHKRRQARTKRGDLSE